ncbi:hypothetical protein V5O48_014561 [Marasmius crinis-equi]|uniref:Uncharacterized protein n=1 Tax=Marasmius crinis-equi TaxID=585013 RepID=A0ABR3EWY4_9AGAR
MPDSDFFRGSARPEFSGESSFTSVGGNSSSSAVQHTVLHIHYPTNVYVYQYGTPLNSPIAQPSSPVNVSVNGVGQHPSTAGGSSSNPGQVPPSPGAGEGRVEGSQGGVNVDVDGNLGATSPADPKKLKKPVQQTLLDRIRAFFRTLRRL